MNGSLTLVGVPPLNNLLFISSKIILFPILIILLKLISRNLSLRGLSSPFNHIFEHVTNTPILLIALALLQIIELPSCVIFTILLLFKTLSILILVIGSFDHFLLTPFLEDSRLCKVFVLLDGGEQLGHIYEVEPDAVCQHIYVSAIFVVVDECEHCVLVLYFQIVRLQDLEYR